MAIFYNISQHYYNSLLRRKKKVYLSFINVGQFHMIAVRKLQKVVVARNKHQYNFH